MDDDDDFVEVPFWYYLDLKLKGLLVELMETSYESDERKKERKLKKKTMKNKAP